MSQKINTVDQLIRDGVFDVNLDELIGALLPVAQQKAKADLKLVLKDDDLRGENESNKR